VVDDQEDNEREEDNECIDYFVPLVVPEPGVLREIEDDVDQPLEYQ